MTRGRSKSKWPTDKRETNRHGLRRRIPESVAREVRQRCGFGCIICGNAFVDYDHFDPDFANAKEHKASGIILLCRHHHGLKTSRLLSKKTIEKRLSNPLAFARGFSAQELDIGSDWPEIVLGPATVKLGYIVLECEGKEVLRVDRPEVPEGPFRLNATFRDYTGKVTLQIVDNIWQTHSGNWDAIQEGPRITIRRGPRDIVLVLHAVPPDKLVVERLNMMTANYHIQLNGENISVVTPSGRTDTLGDVTVGAAYSAISIGPDGVCLNAPALPTNPADLPSPSAIAASSEPSNSPAPTIQSFGAITFGNKPTSLGGASIRNLTVFGGSIRAAPGGGAELYPELGRKKDTDPS